MKIFVFSCFVEWIKFPETNKKEVNFRRSTLPSLARLCNTTGKASKQKSIFVQPIFSEKNLLKAF